jgi:hypothetical protein
VVAPRRDIHLVEVFRSSCCRCCAPPLGAARAVRMRHAPPGKASSNQRARSIIRHRAGELDRCSDLKLTRRTSGDDDPALVRSGESTNPRQPPAERSSNREDTVVAIDRFRTGKAYAVGEAARLGGIRSSAVRRWLEGYDAPGHRLAPVFGSRGDDSRRLSSLELVELIVASVSARLCRTAHGFHSIGSEMTTPIGIQMT